MHIYVHTRAYAQAHAYALARTCICRQILHHILSHGCARAERNGESPCLDEADVSHLDRDVNARKNAWRSIHVNTHSSSSLLVCSRFPRPHRAYASPFKTGVEQDLGAWNGAAAKRCGNQLCLMNCAVTLRIILGCLSALRLLLAVAPALALAVAVAAVITRRTAGPHGDWQHKVHQGPAGDAVGVCCSQSAHAVC